ncbi:MAG: site-specific integrase [Nitriliruptoraceae bacterium]|nr:site-specific integrase [Nitriliruptoraceae bacterium]
MASIKKRPNGRWRARYRDPAGKEHARHFDRKADAQRWLDETTASVVTGQYVAPDAGRLTFRAYAEDWRKAQVHRPTSAAKTESLLRIHCYPTFGSMELRAILPSHVQAWVKGLTTSLAPSTIAVVHGVFASVMKAAVHDRRIPSSPCVGTKLPADHRDPVVPLSLEQVRKLERALPERYRALVTLAAATGLRQGEAFGLTVDRSGIAPPTPRPTLLVDRQLVLVDGLAPYLGPPKRRASRRELPLPQVAADALAAHLASFPPTEQELVCRDAGGREWTETVQLVFTTPRGRPIRRSKFSDVWRPAVARAKGVPAGTTFHDLRHFYASLLIAHGESVKVVQARLGHATAAETLDTYAHLWPDSEDRTRAAVDSVLGAAADSVRTGGTS